MQDNFFTRLFSSKKKVTATEPKEGETEFTFIWFKKMINGSTTHYTQPFRTKVFAKTRDEAKKKVSDFALQRMTLVVVDEDSYKAQEIYKMRDEFDKMNKEFDRVFKEMDNEFKK
jgi:hypothetical protein